MELQTQSADGRTIVIVKDDQGEPYKWATDRVSILNTSTLNEIFTIPLYRETTPKRPPLLKGTLIVQAQIAFDPTILDFATADVVVVGYVGSTGTALARAQLGGNRPLLRLAFKNEDSFDRISVEAQMLRDGQVGPFSGGIKQMDVSAVLTMWH